MYQTHIVSGVWYVWWLCRICRLRLMGLVIVSDVSGDSLMCLMTVFDVFDVWLYLMCPLCRRCLMDSILCLMCLMSMCRMIVVSDWWLCLSVWSVFTQTNMTNSDCICLFKTQNLNKLDECRFQFVISSQKLCNFYDNFMMTWNPAKIERMNFRFD